MRPLACLGFAIGLAGAAALMSGCDTLDKFDTTLFDTKTKLAGERKEVFPGGVPGVTPGVPPELVKGYREAPDAPPAPEQKAAEAKPAPKPAVHVAKPQPAPHREAQPQPAQTAQATASAPAAQPPPGSAPLPWPGQAQQQQPQAAWPSGAAPR